MKPTQKILNGRESVKVAIVQTAPVFLDKDRTINKACENIALAAKNNAELIVFGEAFVAGYPYWGEGWESPVDSWMELRTRFFDNSMLIPSEDTERLCEAAAKANAIVVIGCNEMDSRPGVYTIYNTLLYINRDGKVLGRHRKVMPTFVERAVWGWGDGSDLISFQTDIGRIGGLICGENLMTLLRAHLIQQGEDFHIAVFPGAFALHCGPKLEEADLTGEFFWGNASTRAHALESGSFVLSACGYITEDDISEDFPMKQTLNIDYAHGGSSVSAPLGIPLVKPTSGDTIVYAVCPAQMIKVWKAIIDASGHYSRPDIVSLSFHPKPYQKIAEVIEKTQRGELERYADRYEVSLKDVEAVVDQMAP
ncbi:carbon-nitrogen hydrolase family protein [Nostoc sp. CENA67]|uniref:Carbon-nitrogen hydrolase family protein n=1 Tax=Amazonocrinis nigriterrae CENA67 TaxID=2794033 RepID=A0A8J7HL03_9NOST|nr:carbon-nitrogen hydrolase family protein [Amazonocrinis nigriterrae]MBH8561536.1 carbon-nitrogen hydrolase family protein [Amazonocrinis nigriterrae CENA67]